MVLQPSVRVSATPRRSYPALGPRNVPLKQYGFEQGGCPVVRGGIRGPSVSGDRQGVHGHLKRQVARLGASVAGGLCLTHMLRRNEPFMSWSATHSMWRHRPTQPSIAGADGRATARGERGGPGGPP